MRALPGTPNNRFSHPEPVIFNRDLSVDTASPLTSASRSGGVVRVLIKRDTTSNTPNIKLLSSRKGFRDRSRFPTLPSALTYTILVLRSVKVGLLEYCCRVVESSTTNGHVERN